VAALTPVAVAILESVHMRIALGDVPTWCAFIAAVVAGYIAFAVYRIEKSRDRVADEEERRRQAEKVAAWYGNKQEGTVLVGAGVQKQTVPKFAKGAYARNASELPVYNFAARFYLPKPGRNWIIPGWRSLMCSTR
jgi:hypothetical protein